MDIKFCGIRCGRDAALCNLFRPDYMGMILSPGFRRSITAEQAAAITRFLSPEIQTVGVFVDASVSEIMRVLQIVPLHIIQLHGHETASQILQLKAKIRLPVWKAVRVQCADDIRQAEQIGADRLILEGYVPKQIGGTGVTADWHIIARAKPHQPYFLAGGLKPDNLQTALQIVQPDGVDFSSGTESNGGKDRRKMEEIIRVVRGESSWIK